MFLQYGLLKILSEQFVVVSVQSKAMIPNETCRIFGKLYQEGKNIQYAEKRSFIPIAKARGFHAAFLVKKVLRAVTRRELLEKTFAAMNLPYNRLEIFVVN